MLATAPVMFDDLVMSRRSWLGWTGEPVERATLEDILGLANLAPSECNLQPWRFVVAQGPSLEAVLPAFIPPNRPKVAEAGTIVAVFGDPTTIDGDEKATAFYALPFSTRRDFAVRNAALAAMLLMMAAQSRGVVTRPMIGFDPVALAEMLAVPAEWVPVVVVAAGYPGEARHTERARRPVAELTRFI